MLNISPLQSQRNTPRSALKKKNFALYNPNQRQDRKGNLIGIGTGYQITISEQIQYFQLPKVEKDDQARKLTAASPECGLEQLRKSSRNIETVIKQKTGIVRKCGSIQDNQFQSVEKNETKIAKSRKDNKCCVIM